MNFSFSGVRKAMQQFAVAASADREGIVTFKMGCLRQLLHMGYEVAAEMRDRYLSALETHAAGINPHVAENLFDRQPQTNPSPGRCLTRFYGHEILLNYVSA